MCEVSQLETVDESTRAPNASTREVRLTGGPGGWGSGDRHPTTGVVVDRFMPSLCSFARRHLQYGPPCPAYCRGRRRRVTVEGGCPREVPGAAARGSPGWGRLARWRPEGSVPRGVGDRRRRRGRRRRGAHESARRPPRRRSTGLRRGAENALGNGDFHVPTTLDTSQGRPYTTEAVGSLAQLVEQLTFNQRVIGSSPIRPTTEERQGRMAPSTSGSGHHPFKVAARVRIP